MLKGQIDPSGNKECTSCHKNLSLDSFNKASSTKTGYSYSCKSCQGAYQRGMKHGIPNLKKLEKSETKYEGQLNRNILELEKIREKLEEETIRLSKYNNTLKLRIKLRSEKLIKKTIKNGQGLSNLIDIKVLEGTKICRCCLKQKTSKEFYNKPKNPDGLYTKCISCVHDSYINNKERHYEYVYKWNKENPDKFKEIQKRYRKKISDLNES